MKKLLFTLLMLFVFSISAYAQTEMSGQQGQMGQGMTMGQGQQMPIMCPKMQQMSGQSMMQGGQQMPMMQTMCQGMMMQQNMMQMMMDMIGMQESMLKGVKAAEKKKMVKDIALMKEKLQGMMATYKCSVNEMMKQQMPEPPVKPEGKETPKEAPPATEQHKHQ